MSDVVKKVAGVAALCAAGGIVYYVFSSNGSSSTTDSSRRSGGVTPQQQSGKRTPGPAASPSAAQEKRVFSIIYATATGTSELFGKALAAEAKLKGFSTANLFAGDAYNTLAQSAAPETEEEQDLVDAGTVPSSIFALKSETVVVLLVSTTGEGEPTDDFAEFYNDLMAAAKAATEEGAGVSTLLSGLKYAIFGLGDRQYKYFCECSKRTDEALQSLGATRLLETANGDVQQNMEDHFDEWRENVWELVGPACGVDLVAESEEPPKPEYEFKFRADLNPSASPFPSPPSALEPTQKNPMLATVSEKKQLLQKPGGPEQRSTLSIRIDIEKSAVTYQGGDHCGVFAPAARSIAEEYLVALEVPQDQWHIVVELGTSANAQARASKANILPGRVTLVDALRWYVDLCGVPRKSALRTCAKYCQDEAERKEFSAILGCSTQYRTAIKENNIRTVLDWFKLFPSSAKGIPIGHFIEIMPKNNPRFYSIASDQLVHKKTVHLTVALVVGGLCSEFFRSVEEGEKVPIFVRKSTFHLPLRAKDRPLIMIGPGTGIAPLIGFCHRRSAWLKKKVELGPCLFLFGCRRSDEDYLHQEELTEWRQTDKIITDLQVAFSREQDEKVYVQDLIRKEKVHVHDLLVNKGANLYLCGDAKYMAKDVERTLVEEVLMGVGQMSEEAAQSFIERAEKGDRFLKDVWA